MPGPAVRAGTAAAARAHEIRRLVLELAIAAGTCHIGSALSVVDILATLHVDVMHDVGGRPDGRAGDRLILSKGHAAAALYAALAEAGLLDRDHLLAGYCRDGGAYAGHPERTTPGVTAGTGSLGHGLAIGLGLALADRADGDDRRTFCVLGDGELNEGSVWEAAALAGHLRLDGLVAVIDANGLQGLGDVEAITDLEPLPEKFAAFGWAVAEVPGHDCAALAAALSPRDRPLCVVARTVKGKGVDFMEGDFRWHYRSLREADRPRVEAALARGRAA